jgi:hypothetical protein
LALSSALSGACSAAFMPNFLARSSRFELSAPLLAVGKPKRAARAYFSSCSDSLVTIPKRLARSSFAYFAAMTSLCSSSRLFSAPRVNRMPLSFFFSSSVRLTSALLSSSLFSSGSNF